MENVLKKQSESLRELLKNSVQEKRILESSRKQLVDIYKKMLEQNSLVKSMAILLDTKLKDTKIRADGSADTSSNKPFLSAEEKEFKLEETSLLEEQNSLLREIAENTKGLGGARAPEPVAPKEGGGLLGGVKNWLMGKAAKVGGAAAGAVGRLGKMALARPGLAAGLTVGATTALGGYLSYKRAGKEESAANKEIDSKVAKGEITEEQAAQLKEETKKTATVGRNEAVGKGVVGTGGALLGAKGGAIAGAKLGSFLGPKGAIVGGVLGAGIGAVAGSQVGKDIGGFVGRTVGKVKNFTSSLFSSKSDSKTSADINETAFAKNDSDTFKKYQEFKTSRETEIAQELAKKEKLTEPTETHKQIAAAQAKNEAIEKFKSEAKAAGALTGSADAVKQSQDQTTQNTTNRVEKTANMFSNSVNSPTSSGSLGISASTPSSSNATNVPMAPAARTNSVAVEKKSSEADAAKTSAMKPSSGGNTIVAPSTTVNNNQSKVSIKAPIRNQESSQSQYLRNRYVA